MEDLWKALLALGLCAGVYGVTRLVKLWLYRPLRDGEIRTRVTVYAKGAAPGLENAVRSQRWLAGRGEAEILIADEGMTPEARSRAEVLARVHRATLLPAEQRDTTQT
jgi:hypothetical protein